MLHIALRTTTNPAQQQPTEHMKTKSYHISNFGRFAPTSAADVNGYVTYHDSDRYAKASDDKLAEWAESRTKAVRNAALTEQAQRNLRQWRGE